MKYRLRKRDQLIGRNWAAKVPETGAVLTAASRIGLIPKVAAHLRANGLPPMQQPEEDIDSFICYALSEELKSRRCVIVPEGKPPARPVSGIADIVGFLKFVKDNGFSFVPQEVAEARAATCASCPYLSPIGGCGPCTAARSLLETTTEMLGGRKTRLDDLLTKKACGVCGCSSKVKVHLDIKVPYRNAQFPSWCWQTEETNYEA